MGPSVAIFCSLFMFMFFLYLALNMSSKEWNAAQEKSRARRMAEHRMNARLLRLDI